MDPSDQKVAGRAERGLSDGDNVEGTTAARGREGAVLFVRLHFQEDGDRLTDLSLPACLLLSLSFELKRQKNREWLRTRIGRT